jgi:hypothetical protein
MVVAATPQNRAGNYVGPDSDTAAVTLSGQVVGYREGATIVLRSVEADGSMRDYTINLNGQNRYEIIKVESRRTTTAETPVNLPAGFALNPTSWTAQTATGDQAATAVRVRRDGDRMTNGAWNDMSNTEGLGTLTGNDLQRAVYAVVTVDNRLALNALAVTLIPVNPSGGFNP